MAKQQKSELVVVLPLPAKELGPNSRAGWRATAKATAKARLDAKLAAIDAMNRAGVNGPWVSATVRPVFYHGTKRQRDKDNLSASLKAARDGVVAAGLLTNDEHLTPLPAERRLDKGNPRVELHFRAVDAEST